MQHLVHNSLQGQGVLVTGASYDGIGGATCRLLAQYGARIIACDRDPSGPERLAAEYDTIVPLIADICDPQLPTVLDGLLAQHNMELDILVNNAGIGRGNHAINTTDEELRLFLEVNLVAAFRLSRWAVARMMQRQPDETGWRGAIVNVSSVFGVVGAENSAAYSTSKAALGGLTTQMATDYGPSGIRINAVAPGLILTPLTADRIRNQPWRSQIMVDQAPIRRLGQPIDVAHAIRFLASHEAAYITGLTVPVDGGWIAGRFPRETPIV